MVADLFLAGFCLLWTGLFLSAVIRLDNNLMRGAELRAAVLLLETRRNV